MPYTYEFVDEANGCIIATWHDSHSPEEFLAFFNEIREHPKFRAGLNRLVDFRSVRISLSQDQLQQLRTAVEPEEHKHGRRKVAMLVSDDLSFGIMRQYMIAVAPENVAWSLTRDVEKAVAWVGLPVGYVLPADISKAQEMAREWKPKK